MYTNNWGREEVFCIPHMKVKGDMIITMIITQAHQMLVHLGAQWTRDYICRWYWWPKLSQEVNKYCHSCPTCQATKTDNQKPLACFTVWPYLHDHGGQSLWTLWYPFPQVMGMTTCGLYSVNSHWWCIWFQSKWLLEHPSLQDCTSERLCDCTGCQTKSCLIKTPSSPQCSGERYTGCWEQSSWCPQPSTHRWTGHLNMLFAQWPRYCGQWSNLTSMTGQKKYQW